MLCRTRPTLGSRMEKNRTEPNRANMHYASLAQRGVGAPDLSLYLNDTKQLNSAENNKQWSEALDQLQRNRGSPALQRFNSKTHGVHCPSAIFIGAYDRGPLTK